MDKNAIKKFAIWARRELIERVSQRAMIYGISSEEAGDPNADSVNGYLLSAVEKRQRQALIQIIKEKGYEQVMEEVAYTWFNRFAALRFMEVNSYLPSHIRVFTNDAGEFKPQILTEAIHLELDGLEMKKVYELESDNKSEELFKYLLIVQCNALNSILPGMFQRIDDYTELLLPDYLLRDGSVIEQMVTTIPEEDWTDQVQIIGWLYQYYNTEPKDKVFADLKKNIKISKDNIPAATQLFTPDWIVHYMVENSLGRLFINKRMTEGVFADGLGLDEMTWEAVEEERIFKEKNIADQMGWNYYLPEAKQEPTIRDQLDTIKQEYVSLKPEEIRVVDPCMGSGHILCVLFDVLVQIYEAYGYTSREAAVKIVENNLWGLDIDERATQLSYFAVMMKARQYDRRFFAQKVQPHIYAIEDSNGITSTSMHDMGLNLSQEEYRIASKQAMRLVEEMHDAKEYGSIIHVTPCDWDVLRRFAMPREDEGQLNFNIHGEIEASARLQKLLNVGETLAQKYHVVVTNPPYMGITNCSSKVVEYVKKKYSNNRIDLFSVFMERTIDFLRPCGAASLITQQTWMFISSFKTTRDMIRSHLVTSVNHLGTRAFEDISGEVVQSVAYCLTKAKIDDYVATFVKLDDVDSKNNEFNDVTRRYYRALTAFDSLPDGIFAYWLSEIVLDSFKMYPPASKYCEGKIGLQTGDNNRFLRLWQEVDFNRISINGVKPNCYWVPYNKAGSFRRWYGNHDYVLNWSNDGLDIINCRDEKGRQKSRPQNRDYYFKKGITWSDVCTGSFSMRDMPAYFVFDSCAPTIFGGDSKYLLGLYNSKVAQLYLDFLAPTIHYTCGSVLKMPIVKRKDFDYNLVDECIQLAKKDWDSYENSWEYQRHPLLQYSLETGKNCLIADCFNRWELECEQRFDHLKRNEKELNRFFIEIYGLENELHPDCEDDDITIRRANLQRDILSLISFGVGCMFGRYSLDVPGLVYAGGKWDSSKYLSFEPDADAIIPICDDEYFEDDIVSRFVEFVRVAFGNRYLEENLSYIADVLGGKGTSRVVIRNYFINSFFKDHCNMYQVTGSGKRPIYWLFDSGKKNGFKCLVYMHRYQPDTIARIRTDYVHEQQSRYRTAITDMEQRITNASGAERVKLTKQLTKLQGQAEEVRVYEERIHHLADQMIEINLDDGVKYNYALFKDVLAKI